MSVPRSTTTRRYDLTDRTQKFADNVRLFCSQIPKTIAEPEDLKQVKRSSGSVGANYIEANEALGKADFLMRCRICLKEAKESAFWLRMIHVEHHSSLEIERQRLTSEAEQFVRIFCTIIRRVNENK
ncbi:MAG: hypothetical protein Greene041662_385 [Candidatus Peregrinibacteria bacterium Greene0416_62]|nr:MAG: hypothetical protein Greene041662_385 [Candidatus Peregrinibacteria bacterium Greene0416_62]TSC99550.1 MAG: hypothetical protein Greene101449_616 [Candidatus Peregrinibacteria bacterium Greene1014_49]